MHLITTEVTAMCSDIESARQRLQSIFCELEQCCADDETFSPKLVEEAHTLARLLHEEGYSMATQRQGNTIVVEIEPMQVEPFAA
jgi:hypothetical protein